MRTMDDGVLLLLLFLAIKVSTYSAWCWVGLRWMRPGETPRIGEALLLGVVRVVLGVAVGAALAAVLSLVPGESNRLGFSMGLFLPALLLSRWLVWSVLGTWIGREHIDAGGVLAGRAPRATLWRVLGLPISFLTDLGTLFGSFAAGVGFC